jgi:hypothetical protein
MRACSLWLLEGFSLEVIQLGWGPSQLFCLCTARAASATLSPSRQLPLTNVYHQWHSHSDALRPPHLKPSIRRSSRLQQQRMSEQERFESDLAQLVSEGVCPRCGEAVSAAVREGEAEAPQQQEQQQQQQQQQDQRAHLEGCKARRRSPEPEERPVRVRRTDVEVSQIGLAPGPIPGCFGGWHAEGR